MRSLDNLPPDLMARAQWVVYRIEGRDGKPTKVPHVASSGEGLTRAKADDPKTWRSYAEARRALSTGRYSGIGYVFAADDPFTGIDLDSVLDAETGEVSKEAVRIVQDFDSYTEVSPSGTGLHIIVEASLSDLQGRRKGKVEMYDQGRFFTMTGLVYGELRPVAKRQAQLEHLHRRIFGTPAERPTVPAKAATTADDLRRDDAALRERMFGSPNGAAIRCLWDGDTSLYGDDASAADLALASHLAWWCDYDLARADVLFRQSALMRPKWNQRHSSDGRTYGQMTLERAGEGKGPGDGFQPKWRNGEGSNATRAQGEIVVNRHIKEVVGNVTDRLKALELSGHPRIYSRGDGLLVEMDAAYRLREVTKPDSLKALLHDYLKPVKEMGDYTAPAVFSNNHTTLLLRKTAEFPPIKAVSDIPLMLPNGTILLEPGYHRAHGYFLNTAGVAVQLMPLDEARSFLLETFDEFSYRAPRAGFTATLAFILQPFLMPVIDDLTPMYAVLGSRRSGSGAGKGYLLDCVYRIHCGRPYTHDGSMPTTDDELSKVLFSALSEGTSHIIFDDIEHLKHRSLMAAITSRTYKGRILGASQRHEVSTGVTWAVSGNAPEIHRDFYRRIIPIRLGVGQEKAWERTYTRPDLHRYVLEHRNLYVSAALSILEHWRKLGMPLSTNTIRGFDRWSAVMGGVLEAAGFPDLLGARDGLDELVEVDNSDLDLLIDAWLACSLADKKLKGKDLLYLAQSHELFTELYEGRTEASGASELGKFLKPFTDDVFRGCYLRREFDSDSKTWRYLLEAVPSKPKLLSEVFSFAAAETTPGHPRRPP